jgi:DNA-binding transcriptional MerR regulator
MGDRTSESERMNDRRSDPVSKAAGGAGDTAMARTYSISELAGEFDITTRTIRFYEDQGLLEPARRGRQRVYTHRDRVRLKLILRGKRLGFSLTEILDIIRLYDEEPGEIGQLEFFLAKIAQRRSYLQQQKADIELTLTELDNIERQCRERLAALR